MVNDELQVCFANKPHPARLSLFDTYRGFLINQ